MALLALLLSLALGAGLAPPVVAEAASTSAVVFPAPPSPSVPESAAIDIGVTRHTGGEVIGAQIFGA